MTTMATFKEFARHTVERAVEHRPVPLSAATAMLPPHIRWALGWPYAGYADRRGRGYW